jgi:hypothetical protein
VTLRLRVSEPSLAEALATFLNRRECVAETTATGWVILELPHELHEKQAHLELRLYVRLWEVLNETRVDIVST